MWHFDEGDSMSVDATGTSNDAVYLSGCASVDGRYGKGLALDGESYAEVNDDPALELGASDWTIEAWAKADDPVTSGEVVSKWADGGNWSWKIEITSAAHVMLSLSTDGSSVAVELVSNAALSANEWVHIAATCDASADTVSLWIDGVQDVTASFSGTLYDGTAEVRLGAGFDGILDEVRISNCDRSGELGETELLYTYNERNQLVESHDPSSTSVVYYSYDLNGNTTRIQSMANAEALFATTMNYDTLNRCTEINSPNGVETMAYRGSEWHRYSTTANGVTTNFLYDGDNVVADLQSSAIVKIYNTPFLDQNVAMYTVAGETITPYYYAHDGLGSVRTLTAQDASLKSVYDYYAFGGAYAPGTSETLSQRYQFTGRGRSIISDNLFYRYRSAYVPSLGIFTNRNPWYYIQERFGLYDYTGNDPVNYTEPFSQKKKCHVVTYPEPKEKDGKDDDFETRTKKAIEDKKAAGADWSILEVKDVDDANKKVKGVPCLCVETLEIAGHGNSWDDMAIQEVGSTNNGELEKWGGKTAFGVKDKSWFGGTFGYEWEPFGIDAMFGGIDFCKPCTIILRGCNTGKTAAGKAMYAAIAAKTGCKVQGFDEKTFSGKDDGLPGKNDAPHAPNVTVEPPGATTRP